MREVTFKYGSREKGWKYYSCTEKESKWDKERAELWGLEGNMAHWTYPKEDISINRKHKVDTEGVPMGMDYARVNYKNLCKKLKDITKNMQEENFPEQPEKTTFYWELLIENYDVEETDISPICIKKIKSFKMWRGTNYEPDGLQDLKECFANYYKNR